MHKRRTVQYEMDMCSGALLPKVLRFSLPLMLTGILQLLYNAADIVVVGQFAANGTTAVAAVSSTGSLINLIVNVFMGLSVGASVVVARCYGANDREASSRAVHSAIGLSLAGGVIVGIFGLLMARRLLTLMGTPADVLDQAALYTQIYFAGMLPNMVYNFGAAILRAVGDTRRPLYFLIISGLANVLFNLFFVTVLKMDVAGVALATVISQVISAILVMQCLIHSSGIIRFSWKRLRIHRSEALQIARIGLPAGLQGTVFSISNVLIQSSINSFGSAAMAGNGAASNIEGFVYTAMNALYQAAISFTSQNVGAKRFDRIGRILGTCLGVVTTVGLVLGVSVYWCGEPLLRLYLKQPAAEVLGVGMTRLSIVCSLYFLCGIMDTMVGSLRGMGASVVPMIVSMLGACGLRILWIVTVFQVDRQLSVLYWSYPISWTVTAAAHAVCYLYVRRKLLHAAGTA